VGLRNQKGDKLGAKIVHNKSGGQNHSVERIWG